MEELQLLVAKVQSQCLTPDGKPLAADLPCLNVAESLFIFGVAGNAIADLMTYETLCRAPAAGMGGVQ